MLTDLIDELQIEIDNEAAFIKGCELLQGFDLTPEAKEKLSESIAYATMRNELLGAAKIAVSNLANSGYPIREKQSAKDEILDELKGLVHAASIAVSDLS